MLASYECFGALLRAAVWPKIEFLAVTFSQRRVFDRFAFFAARPANRFFLVAMLRLLRTDGHTAQLRFNY
jgi:hypothetical protein